MFKNQAKLHRKFQSTQCNILFLSFSLNYTNQNVGVRTKSNFAEVKCGGLLILRFCRKAIKL